MSTFNLNDMSEQQFDVLKEIGNIGAGNAATALSKLINKKVDMSVPVVKLCDFDEITEFVGSEDTIMVGILLGIEGDINGMMMFLFDKASCSNLVSSLMGFERNKESEFDDMELSALSEIGNIVSGAYLTSLSTLTNLSMLSTVPSLSIDMVGALLSIPAAEYGQVSDQFLLIETQFGDEDFLKGHFLLIPDLDSYEKILHSLGV